MTKSIAKIATIYAVDNSQQPSFIFSSSTPYPTAISVPLYIAVIGVTQNTTYAFEVKIFNENDTLLAHTVLNHKFSTEDATPALELRDDLVVAAAKITTPVFTVLKEQELYTIKVNLKDQTGQQLDTNNAYFFVK